MSFTIWHNPRCTKSRQTLDLLKKHGINPTVRLYLEDVPSEKEIKAVAKLLNKKPIEFTRTREDEFKKADLSKQSSDDDIFNALSKYPKLIERPIVIKGNKKAVIGRPPKNILPLL